MFQFYKLAVLLLATGFLCVMAIPGITGAVAKKKNFDPANMDHTINPGDDFYNYVNGNWIKQNPIPEDRSRWGNFEALAEMNSKQLKTILLEAKKDKNAPANSNIRKIGDFYATAMDEIKIEEDGIKDLEAHFKKIAGISNKKEFQKVVAYLHTLSVNPLFNIMDAQDPGNSNIVITHIGQGGMGLPDRDYYTDNNERSKTIREEYLNHMGKMFGLLKDSPGKAVKNAQTVLAIETRLAKASMTRVQRRNPKATYNRKTLKELQYMFREYDFAGYFNSIGLQEPGNINVRQPKFFLEMTKVVKETSLDDLKVYLRWHLITNFAPYLSQEFVNENFRFFSKTLRGAKTKQKRWKRTLRTINRLMGEALGQIFVKRHFPPEAKTRAYKMVMTLKEVLADRIKKLDWMSPETKKQALAKLNAFEVKIGYPDKWVDYTTLMVKRDSYIKNIIRALEFQHLRAINKIGKAPDRSEWGMPPQTVNAYYHPLLNHIVFPAAILQPPFFDFEADDALNFGGIGAAIGHEMTHGFDDQGSQYDKDGNLKNWWTKEDGEKFKARAQLLEKQYSDYVVIDDVHVNGKLTLGENIADLGGLSVAYEGLMRSLDEKQKSEKIDGFTPQQRFFLAWGRIWRNNIRKEALLLRIKTDPHSPGPCRVIGPLINMPAFYKAFGIKEGDKLYKSPKDRIVIW